MVEFRAIKKKPKSSKLCGLIFSVFAKGINACFKLDDFIKQFFCELGDDYVVLLSIFGSKNKMAFFKKKSEIKYCKNEKTQNLNTNLQVEFKSLQHAKDVLLGRISIANAYCKHYFAFKGDICIAVKLVEVLTRVECYLFPKFIIKKAITQMPKKQTGKFRIYLKMLFGF